MQDANLAATENFGLSITSSGLMLSFEAPYWIYAMNNANYLGYSDWSLPSLDSLSHMYKNNLGGTGQPITGDEGPFANIQLGYWSNQKRDPFIRRYFFCFSSCYDYNFEIMGPGDIHFGDDATVPYASWAVREGDVPTVVPEPISSTLFVVGGALLAGQRCLRRKKIA